MNNLVFTTSIEEIHSFDSYFGRIIDQGGSVIIPVINLGVSNHPLNQTGTMKYIDKSYLLFEGVSSMLENYDLSTMHDNLKVFYLGGLDTTSGIHREWQIRCKKVSLLVLAESTLSEEMWIPKNMNHAQVEAFLKSRPNLL